MQRLTERNGLCVKSKFSGDFGSQNILHALADYEDAEEQGLLIKLPCKVGDTVYYIYQFEDNKEIVVIKDEVDFINIRENRTVVKTVTNAYFDDSDFNKTVFLTKEEAEQALAEMKGE